MTDLTNEQMQVITDELRTMHIGRGGEDYYQYQERIAQTACALANRLDPPKAELRGAAAFGDFDELLEHLRELSNYDESREITVWSHQLLGVLDELDIVRQRTISTAGLPELPEGMEWVFRECDWRHVDHTEGDACLGETLDVAFVVRRKEATNVDD